MSTHVITNNTTQNSTHNSGTYSGYNSTYYIGDDSSYDTSKQLTHNYTVYNQHFMSVIN